MEGIMDFLQKGGPVLLVIIGLSLVVFTIIIERLIFFYKIREKRADVSSLFSLIKDGKYKEVDTLLLKKNSPLLKALYNVILNRGLSPERQKEELEIFIMKETPNLLFNLDFIAVATTAAPILGLLGTVTGMIKVFNALSRLGSPDAHLLARGISEALITTEAGLVVAIPCLFLHNFLASKAEGYIFKMRHQGMRLITLFDNDKKA